MKTSPTSVRGNTLLRRTGRMILVAGFLPGAVLSQTSLTWPEIRAKFEAANPTLRASQLGIDESRASEITAYLRPNPDFTGTIDQINPLSNIPSPASGNSVYRPFAYALPFGSVSYLHEREHKRELRLDSARKSTRHRGLHLLGSGAHPAVQPAKRLRANFAGESGAAERQGKPGVLGPGTRGESHSLPGRRSGAGGSQPAGTAARAVRVRSRNGDW